jgi:Ca2+-binding RTX toxin-like protein
MPQLNFYLPAQMNNRIVWYGDVYQATSSKITLSDGYNGGIYYGRGFSYSYYDVVGGTLTGYDSAINVISATRYTLEYSARGFSLDAATAYQYIQYGNPYTFDAWALSGNDLITGSLFNDYIIGYAGNDLINGLAGADTMVGGAGDDTYVVDNTGDIVIENAGEGIDLVQVAIAANNGSYTLSDNVENVTLTNRVAFNLTGNDLNNVLIGNAAANTLTGLDGDDTLNGLGGADTMIGGIGSDTYIVDNVGDIVRELVGDAGTDLVQSSVSYSLNTNDAAGVENLTLTGNAAINGTGNALNNIITGNNGANILNGGAGDDTLIGGLGNDTYVIDSLGDDITELANAGTDLVQVAIDSEAVTYVLGDNLENATITNTTRAHNLTGNGLNNTLTGNSQNNILDGGAGVDRLIGGLGDDTYIVDLNANGTLQDTIVELANGGIDTLQLRGAYTNTSKAATLTLVANLENLDISAVTGSGKLNLTGNKENNILTGNDTDNILNGLAGADTMVGGAGDDTYVVDNEGDTVIENAGEGIDLVQVAIATAGGTYTLTTNVENGTLTNRVAFNLTGNDLNNVLIGNAAANTLTGGDGNDRLIGGLGNDTLTGGEGSDTFVFNTALNSRTNLDTITDFVSGTDKIEIAKSIMTRLGNVGELTEAQFKIGAAASESPHRIIYNETTGGLFYDADGSGTGAAVQIAILGTNLEITHQDFWIV